MKLLEYSRNFLHFYLNYTCVNAGYSDFINKFMSAIDSTSPIQGKFETLIWQRNNLSNTKNRLITEAATRGVL